VSQNRTVESVRIIIAGRYSAHLLIYIYPDL
jgi:hypothetical protein